MRAKVAQEQLVEAGPVPCTIVRSTHFFELVAGIADAAAVDREVHATPGRLQPIASSDVVTHLADVVTAAAANKTLGIDELVRQLFAVSHNSRTVVTDPHARYFGAELDANLLTPTPGADDWTAPTAFDVWLHSHS